MANHMEAIAKLLGLELGEEFKIKGYTDNHSPCYRLTLNGLEFKTSASAGKWFKSHDDTLHEICTDDIQIAKLPFKPEYDEEYWYAQFNECIEGDKGIRGLYTRWTNSYEDYSRFKLGNCFRTKEEAEANKKRIYRELTGKEWNNDAQNTAWVSQ